MAERPSFRAPRGTRDVLPPESDRQRALVDAFAAEASRAGYGEIVSPIFEEIGVFLRVGEQTEIVTKEMYDFHDRDGRHMALRPELTASVVRAFVQERPTTPWKVWYCGPQFRYEKPQAGRYRQFTQVGVELMGTDDPAADIEVISLATRFWERLGLARVRLLVNSLGDERSRPGYLEALRAHFEANAAELSDQSRETLARSPLRVLDSKRPEDSAVIAAAPVMVDHLDGATAEHFAQVRAGLDSLGIAYEISPRLVRGLDYYTRTTFEFAADALESAQNAVGGGGRYDSLSEDLGGPPTPGIGFALGVDRILLACDAEETFAAPPQQVSVFVVDVTGGASATRLCDTLRAADIGADRAFDARSMKAQMKVADRSGARWAAIIGEDELAAGTVTLRALRSDEGQVAVAADMIIDEIRRRLP